MKSISSSTLTVLLILMTQTIFAAEVKMITELPSGGYAVDCSNGASGAVTYFGNFNKKWCIGAPCYYTLEEAARKLCENK